jgi:hypothetical protein
MINYKIIPYDNSEKIVYSLLVEEPLTELSIIANLFEDLDYFIEWIEELVTRKIPNFSEPGVIIYQSFLWGSQKSKLVELVKNEHYIEKEIFDTQEFLDLCYAWRDFLASNNRYDYAE